MSPGRPLSVVYLAYGSVALYDQTVMSLLTLSHQLNGDFSGLQVIIYTDNPGRFSKYADAFRIKTELLTAELVRSFKGPTLTNVHRVKTCILKNSLEKYEADVFYLDCDTFFLRNPRSLFGAISPSVSILNNFEYDLYDAGGWENQLWFQLRSAIRDNVFSLSGATVKIPLTTKMWNAGITGISYSNKGLPDQILSLTDQIYSITPVFHAEQFAVSYILQEHTTVISTEDYLEHYWSKDTKAKFSHHFRIFLAGSEHLPVPDLVVAAQSFLKQRDALPMPKVTREPILRRLRKRLELVMQVVKHGHL
jgi:hypothetical protein